MRETACQSGSIFAGRSRQGLRRSESPIKTVRDQTKRDDTGYKTVAEMMNQLDQNATKEILENIEKEDPNLAIGIRDFMFTFDDFLEVPEQELRTLVNSVDKKVLTIALKGASEELRSRFYRTMSTRAVEMFKEDSDVMGPVRSKEVAKAHAEIVAIARKLEAEGAIVLKSRGRRICPLAPT